MQARVGKDACCGCERHSAACSKPVGRNTSARSIMQSRPRMPRSPSCAKFMRSACQIVRLGPSRLAAMECAMRLEHQALALHRADFFTRWQNSGLRRMMGATRRHTDTAYDAAGRIRGTSIQRPPSTGGARATRHSNGRASSRGRARIPGARAADICSKNREKPSKTSRSRTPVPRRLSSAHLFATLSS